MGTLKASAIASVDAGNSGAGVLANDQQSVARACAPPGGGGALFKLLSGGVPLTLWNPDPV